MEHQTRNLEIPGSLVLRKIGYANFVADSRPGMTGALRASGQLLMSADQVFSISLITPSGIGM